MVTGTMATSKFHGRHEGNGRICEVSGCEEPGEFRAAGERDASFDGPPRWRWMCLEHIREFNAQYDWFAGMSEEEILEEQSPIAGWRRTRRPVDAATIADRVPRWADHADPLEAIAARARGIRSHAERQAKAAMAARFSQEEIAALDVLGLGEDVDRSSLRRRYGELVRRYHPDRNGGDRRFEARLSKVVEAYQLLKSSARWR